MSRRRVIIAVDTASRGLTDDDRYLRDALISVGVEVEPRLWGQPVDPGSTVVIRSSWDYVDRPTEFRRWLQHLDAVEAEVHNPTPMLRWNMHKEYLLDLARRRVPVVPTSLLRRGSDASIDGLRTATGWTDLVIKPAVGGTARLALHVGRVGEPDAAGHLASLLAREDIIVQPYLPSITTDGEISIIAIVGHATHAVIKRPRAGDWRVQADFGGSADLIDLEAEHVDLASRALGVLDVVPSYARIDAVRVGDELQLIELELVEPELFFQLDPHSAQELARHVVHSSSGPP